MNRKSAILLTAAFLGGCGHTPNDVPSRGISAVNVPVVTRTDYVFEASAPGGSLAPGEAARLNGWFQGLGVGYGDSIYVDGSYADGARAEVARIAANYGMLVNAGAPVTNGQVADGAVRVVVSRNRASVPGCPNWSRAGDPNYGNRSSPNFGCSVNTNIATLVADPQDLVFGREGSGMVDPRTINKTVDTYRAIVPTGVSGAVSAQSSKEN